ncbi:MAG TPA: site-specific integrase [Terracidiphilus sp.]|nr:site-specific integrase [Terracidiphilus sp.]
MPSLKTRNSHLNSPEYADRVNLIKKIKLGNAWRFAPVVAESNGRLKDRVRINGKIEVHLEGAYYIEWRERGRRKREATTREEAIDAARRKAVELRAIRDGLIAPQAPQETQAKTPIGDAIKDYLRYVKMQRKKRTWLTYRYTLDVLLRASYKKKYAEDATRQDALDFMTHCYELGLGARTVYDKVVTVLQLFKRHGREKLLERGDWPTYVDTIRPIYEPEELTAMFQVTTEDEADVLKFILGSGFRDQEIRYVEYLDLDSRHDLVRVTAKKEWDFTPKNWEERAVPLPRVLMERLKRRKERKKARPHDLIFGNRKGNPDSEMDMIVKRVAERAKLNCGRCETEHGNKCAEGPFCMNFFLHKFRHTYATNHLRDGVDIRTVQAWLGHRDIKSTMVYLKGIRSKDAAQKVNSGELAALVE